MTIRIAMWSGPRNISTALMRSWGSRSDCAVSDEPLYAHYLSELPHAAREAHPAWDDVLASQPADWRLVAERLTGPVPGGRRVWYQKHMAHHLTPGIGTDWVHQLENCFLIRDPAAMIASFVKVIPDPRPEDLGLPQQVELFELVRARTGETPVVIDSADVLADPAGMLGALCARLGVRFDDDMLAWEPGARDTDGVWAPHWYASVYESTGFKEYEPNAPEVPAHLGGVLTECRGLYDQLSRERITSD
ncbi:MAG: branched chain amino acid aminotransferase [Phycisphaeraceae bacterium]|nr:MAG: branched chain amino acid aminotransferase [Phycisphaeraceae bacterium]